MELVMRAVWADNERLDQGGLQLQIRHLLGDDYDMIPNESWEDDEAFLLSPKDFQKAISPQRLPLHRFNFI